MTIAEAAVKATKNRDQKLFNKVLDAMNERGSVHDVVLICDINAYGREGHQWAWDRLEDWQNEG